MYCKPSRNAEPKRKRQLGINLFPVLVSVPLLALLAFVSFIFTNDLQRIKNLALSTSNSHLPQILAKQQMLLNVENMRRNIALVYSASDPTISRNAGITAQALIAESVFEETSVDFSSKMDEIRPQLLRLIELRQQSYLAEDRLHHAEIFFSNVLGRLLMRAGMEYRTPLALLMLDLDFFKNYNDRFGHQAGDAALKAVAQATQKALLRDSDRIFRYGGEEFTIILAGAGQYSAMTVAQRILEEVAALDLVHPDSRTGKLTVSIGIAHRSFGEDADICEVLTHADQALYEAKTSGRNRIVLFEG